MQKGYLCCSVVMSRLQTSHDRGDGMPIRRGEARLMRRFASAVINYIYVVYTMLFMKSARLWVFNKTLLVWKVAFVDAEDM